MLALQIPERRNFLEIVKRCSVAPDQTAAMMLSEEMATPAEVAAAVSAFPIPIMTRQYLHAGNSIYHT